MRLAPAAAPMRGAEPQVVDRITQEKAVFLFMKMDEARSDKSAEAELPEEQARGLEQAVSMFRTGQVIEGNTTRAPVELRNLAKRTTNVARLPDMGCAAPRAHLSRLRSLPASKSSE